MCMCECEGGGVTEQRPVTATRMPYSFNFDVVFSLFWTQMHRATV